MEAQPAEEPAVAPEWLIRSRELAGKRVLVTGGCGYVGEVLAIRLLRLRPPVSLVRLVDIALPGSSPAACGLLVSRRVEYVRCDLSREEPPCASIDVVFHVAGFGMSGSDMIAPPALIRAINFSGTQRVVDACRIHNVLALVYVSTPNVCFGGEPLHNADEDTPYFPVERHVDEYSRSKALAEMAVLAADHASSGSSLGAGGSAAVLAPSSRASSARHLRTAAIRPAAIYGEEERRHLPRIARMMCLGSFLVGIGERGAETEWIHVLSLTDALIAAAGSLLSSQHAPGVGGRAFFVSDGSPMNTWKALAPLNQALGMPGTVLWVPVSGALAFARLCERLSMALRPLVSLPPLLTRAEVFKVAVNHTFSNARAASLLGYAPRFGTAVGMRRVAAAYATSEFAELARDNRFAALALGVTAGACGWLWAHVSLTALSEVVTHML
jgi:nucleoside-diphosphate-sugar epimerase